MDASDENADALFRHSIMLLMRVSVVCFESIIVRVLVQNVAVSLKDALEVAACVVLVEGRYAFFFGFFVFEKRGKVIDCCLSKQAHD